MVLGLKLVRGDETRKVNKLPLNMEELQATAHSLFGLVDLKYQYVDEEGDIVTIKSDSELNDAYALVKEMGQRFMKLMIVDGDVDSNWVAVDEDFEKVESDPEPAESTQEENKEGEKEGCQKGKKGGKWKKQWKQMNQMKSQCMNSIVKVMRTVIREELGYALKGEAPPAVEDMEMNFEKMGIFRMMGPGMMGPKGPGGMGPGMMHPGMMKPKFEITEFTKVKKVVVPGEQNTKTFTIKNTGKKPIPAGSKLIQVRGPEDTSLEMTPLEAVLAPGESVTFAITFNSGTTPGQQKHMFRMQGPKGRKFGPRMGCNYMVIDIESVPEQHRENVEALVTMGFTLEEAREKIIEANGDIGLAVSMISRKE